MVARPANVSPAVANAAHAAALLFKFKSCNGVISTSGFHPPQLRERNRKSKGFGKQSIWRAGLMSQYLTNREAFDATPLATNLSRDSELFRVAASEQRRSNTAVLSAAAPTRRGCESRTFARRIHDSRAAESRTCPVSRDPLTRTYHPRGLTPPPPVPHPRQRRH